MHPDDRAVDLLRELGIRPAVPFSEQTLANHIFSILSELGLDPIYDTYGNIVARHRNQSKDSQQPPIAFVAHMDHPGFEIVESNNSVAVAQALGGVPVSCLSAPARVLVLVPDGRRISAETRPIAEGIRSRTVEIPMPDNIPLTYPTPVVFDLQDFLLDGDLLRMRALDDLAGCATILSAIERLMHNRIETDVFAVFTRAEEVGLYGARLMAEHGVLPRDTLIVSIEASPVIPGVSQGDGPVVRTGDAAYTFDANVEQILTASVERIKRRDHGYKSQRQLMSGGTCEATAFAVFGYQVSGIAYPLGNYHNATKGIANSKGAIAEEYIHLSDFLGGIELVYETATLVNERFDNLATRRIGDVPDRVRQRLAAS